MIVKFGADEVRMVLFGDIVAIDTKQGRRWIRLLGPVTEITGHIPGAPYAVTVDDKTVTIETANVVDVIEDEGRMLIKFASYPGVLVKEECQ